MKNLTIVIAAFLNEVNEYNEIKRIIKTNEFYDLILINDNPDLKIDGFINNDKNYGKFSSVIKGVKNNCKTKYFLTLDPDDILSGGIDLFGLEILSKSLKNYNSEILVNSFFFKQNEKTKFKKKPKHIFNPNTIYLTKKIVSYEENYLYINYMEDLSMLLIALDKVGKVKRINIPFYTYSYGAGYSSGNKAEYKKELKNIKLIVDNHGFRIKSFIHLCIYFTRIVRFYRLYKKNII